MKTYNIKILTLSAFCVTGFLMTLGVSAQVGPADDTGISIVQDDGGANISRNEPGPDDINFPRPPAEPLPEEKEHDCDAKIGDRVWNDMNGNGIQDAGEPGISGVKMKVIDGNDKDYDTTDADGKYKFRDLCGKVRVIVATETLPAGCYQTYDRDGKLDHSYKRKLDDDESYKKADFGYRCPGAVTHKRSPETGAAGALSAILVAAIVAAVASCALMQKRREA